MTAPPAPTSNPAAAGPAASNPVILTEGLRKTYGQHEVVRGLDLRVERGEVFGFLGPNGAGKSTTVKMLLGLVRPTAGRLEVLGGSPFGPKVRARLGFLPEQFRFQTWMTGEEFLRFHAELAGLKGAEARRRVPEVLERVGLGGRGGEQMGGYSKGMLQRAGLASALLARPELVFLDEPTSALDPIGRMEVRQIIEDLRDEGVSVFLNSHLLSEVSQVCDRVAFVRRGTVLWQGELAGLMNSGGVRLRVRVDRLTPEMQRVLEGFGPVRVLAGQANTLELDLDDEAMVPQVAAVLHDLGAAVYELNPQHPELEDIFLQLIGQSGGANASAQPQEVAHV